MEWDDVKGKTGSLVAPSGRLKLGVGPKFNIVLVALTILCSSTVAQETAEDWMATSQDLMMNGSEEEALTAYERTIDLDPQNVEAWRYKAILLRDQGNYDAAISAL